MQSSLPSIVIDIKANNMKRLTLLICICLVFCFQSVSSQSATQILAKVHEKYDAYQSINMALDLEIRYADGSTEKSLAKLIQQDKSYYFDSKDQAVYNDGKNLWIHLKALEEVQLNNADEDEDQISSMSPKSMLSMVNTENFENILLEPEIIEIKPLDEEVDYSKIRMQVDSDLMELKKIWIFGKDGSRIVLEILDLTINETYPSTTFSFVSADHPELHLEDLRID